MSRPPGPGDAVPSGPRGSGTAGGSDLEGASPGGARPDGGGSLTEIVAVFLKISLLGFGGPDVHLALMLDEVVERRGWVDREHFLHLLGITNLLPGPNSSEMAIHLGYARRGWRGALAAGLAFLLPTFVLVTALAAAYFRWGSLPAVEPLFWALGPVVVGLVLVAGWRLLRAVAREALPAVLAAGGIALALLAGTWAVAGMAVGGALAWTIHRRGRERAGRTGGADRPDEDEGATPEPRECPGGGEAGRTAPAGLLLAAPGEALLGSTLLGVFWTHLWMGAVLFGGGYVLIGLLEPYAVDRYAWLTAAEFLDGVALTQAVPGPISTLSAFVGYAAAGVPGAVLGTAGIYLPAFAAVLLAAPHVGRLRESPGARAALDGVAAVAAGVVLGIGLSLVPAAVPGVPSALLFAATLAAGLFLRVAAPLLVLAALAAGLLRVLVT